MSEPYFVPGYYAPGYYAGDEEPLSEFDQMLEDACPDVFEILGAENIILTRDCGITEAIGNSTPPLLLLAAGASAGAAAISLKEPRGASLRGKLEAGSVLTIAGQDYVTQAAVEQPAAGPDPGLTIHAIPILPALAADAAEGDEVGVDGPRFLFRGLVIDDGRNRQERDLNAPAFLIVSLPHRDAPTVPRKGDGLIRPRDGAQGLVSQIPLALGGSWDLQIGVKVGS